MGVDEVVEHMLDIIKLVVMFILNAHMVLVVHMAVMVGLENLKQHMLVLIMELRQKTELIHLHGQMLIVLEEFYLEEMVQKALKKVYQAVYLQVLLYV